MLQASESLLRVLPLWPCWECGVSGCHISKSLPIQTSEHWELVGIHKYQFWAQEVDGPISVNNVKR